MEVHLIVISIFDSMTDVYMTAVTFFCNFITFYLFFVCFVIGKNIHYNIVWNTLVMKKKSQFGCIDIILYFLVYSSYYILTVHTHSDGRSSTEVTIVGSLSVVCDIHLWISKIIIVFYVSPFSKMSKYILLHATLECTITQCRMLRNRLSKSWFLSSEYKSCVPLIFTYPIIHCTS